MGNLPNCTWWKQEVDASQKTEDTYLAFPQVRATDVDIPSERKPRE